MFNHSIIHELYDIDKKVIDFVNAEEKSLAERFAAIDEIKNINLLKILKAMQINKLASTDFAWSTGYGYGDVGRDKIERIYADIFKTEDALVRPSIASGTHALALTLGGLLNNGDLFACVTGDPYDTLLKVIGVRGDSKDSLINKGIQYESCNLIGNSFDYVAIEKLLKKKPKLIEIQRSTGYSFRRAITISEIKECIQFIRRIDKTVIIMVDNCYGEFTEIIEPGEVGADLIVGSLIKNPGGSIALSGGYIAGRSKLITSVSNRLTAPGLGRDIGLTFGTNRSTLQGLYFAPYVVAESLKSAILIAQIFQKMGYEVCPSISDERSDIIQAIKFRNPNMLIEFCRKIQASSTVDSHVTPYPWDMPGYDNQVIMASGGFVEGSSIEMSADAPLKDPYIVYYQGGIYLEHSKLGLMNVLDAFIKEGLLSSECLR